MNTIKDAATREAIKRIEERLRRIENIPQLQQDSTLKQVIDKINIITKSLKRK